MGALPGHRMQAGWVPGPRPPHTGAPGAPVQAAMTASLKSPPRQRPGWTRVWATPPTSAAGASPKHPYSHQAQDWVFSVSTKAVSQVPSPKT